MSSTPETIPWAADLRSAVARFGALPAVHDAAGIMTLAEIAGHAARLAGAVRAAGIVPGQPVAVSLRNGSTAVWASLGLRLCGAAETALNAAMAADERRHCLDLSGARLVVTGREHAAAFIALGCDVIAVEDLPRDAPPLDDLPPVPGAAYGRISFTSGTTGRPKAIVQTHAARWIGNLLQQSSYPTAPGPGNAILLMTPFVHGAGLLSYAFMLRGAASFVMDGVQLDRIAPLLRDGAVDHMFAPPTVLAKITRALAGATFPGMRTIFCGTAPLPPALYAAARAMFGPVIRLTYGKSEINNPITGFSPQECDAYYCEGGTGEGACVGYPGTGVEVQVRAEDGAICGPGESGEVYLRGRHMACGHIDAAGFHALPPDGFHASGDIGVMDGRGRLHLVGRVADVIKSGGYKVHPDEVDRALAGAGVPAAVVSIPSEYWGEIVIAVGEAPDADWQRRAAAALAGLARHKQPRAYVGMPALPRNAQGKVMRRQIRETLAAMFRLADGPHPQLHPIRGAEDAA